MTATLAIFLSQVPTASGATDAPTSLAPLSRQAQESTATPRVAPGKCPSARQAVAYYRAQTHRRQSARGGTLSDRTPIVRGKSCHWARYAARVWIARAKAAMKTLERWRYDWDWRSWLPAKWVRIGICETGLNWRHSNSSYEGAFGFALSSWDAFVPYADRKAGPYPPNAYMATPRQQYEVALAIWRRYGLSGWGCRNA